jgi:site-specific recombinase XerD
LTAREVDGLLRSIETSTIAGVRDRAVIGLMAITFARVSAACGIDAAEVFHQHRRVPAAVRTAELCGAIAIDRG